MYNNKKIVKILEKCLGDKIQYFKDKFVSKQKGGRVFVPHIDGAFSTYNYRLKKKTNGWFIYAKKFIHLQILLSKNTKKNGCLNICKLESENPSYYQKKYFKTKWSKVSSEFPKQFHKKFYKSGKPFTGKEGDVLIFNPLCPHFSFTNKTNSKRDTFLITFNGKSDGNNYKLSNYDKKLVVDKKGWGKNSRHINVNNCLVCNEGYYGGQINGNWYGNCSKPEKDCEYGFEYKEHLDLMLCGYEYQYLYYFTKK